MSRATATNDVDPCRSRTAQPPSRSAPLSRIDPARRVRESARQSFTRSKSVAKCCRFRRPAEMGVQNPAPRRMRIGFGIRVRVVATMYAGPPQRSALCRAGGEQRERELDGARRIEGPMAEVTMVEGSDGKHAKPIEGHRHRHIDRRHTDPECERRADMQQRRMELRAADRRDRPRCSNRRSRTSAAKPPSHVPVPPMSGGLSQPMCETGVNIAVLFLHAPFTRHYVACRHVYSIDCDARHANRVALRL